MMVNAIARVFRPSGLVPFLSRRGLASKPVKAAGEPVGPMETVIGFAAIVTCFLVPSGWILSHLESYKNK